MRTLSLLACLLLLLSTIEAKKSHNSPDESPVEEESKAHSAKKYTKEHQKSHHHSHKTGGIKQAPIEVPESEVKLQDDLTLDKKVDAAKDLHLQDLAYEEELQKKKSKGVHHGVHRADVESEGKLFEAEPKKEAVSVDEKVIEDSFEPLDKKKEGEKTKNKDKKKDKLNKGNKKKAHEKKKGSEKKNKEGNKKHKDKKHKNKGNKKQ